MKGAIMRAQGCNCIIAFVIFTATAVEAQTIPELVRANPDMTIVSGMTQHVRPVAFETLLQESPLVIIGRVHFARSYLTPDELYILSDFTIQLEQVLKGVVPVGQARPGQSRNLILTMYGGEIAVDGKKVSAKAMNTKELKSGERFLVFLQPYGTDVGRYKAAYGAIFEIQDDRMRSLLSMSGGDPFPDLTSRSLGDAMKEIARWRR
jgi:hypothetical protein